MNEPPKNHSIQKKLADGCKYCEKGSKMVLLVTGLCHSNCFYCPISEKKKGKDVIYANELLVKKEGEILEEGELMEAEGTDITGGEPLEVADKTARIIKMLKEYFRDNHYIHLYTSMMDGKKIEKLVASGLDEIRFRPHVSSWEKIDTNFKKIIADLPIDAGIEIPLIPHMKKEMKQQNHMISILLISTSLNFQKQILRKWKGMVRHKKRYIKCCRRQ
ncbi:MAG: 4Fe-4S cluster-binding domain-containing protein [Candidatus Thermoplasmatota archaeon]|nr:4Fe-4S cluster-binding domain-containing protein [Candidatus Thermoplasmatota archaeon]